MPNINIYIYGPWGLVIVLTVLVVWIISDRSRYDLFRSYIFWFLSFFSIKASKNFVQSNIDGHFLEFKNKYNKEFPGMIPYGVKIQWVTETTEESIIKNNDVIIRLKPRKNHNENLAKAAYCYVSNSLLPNTRAHFVPLLRKALDLFVTFELLSTQTRSAASNIFLLDIWEPELSSDENLRKYIDNLSSIEESGNFYNILIREYANVGNRIGSKHPTSAIRDELTEFHNFVYDLSTRQPSESTNLRFSGLYINIGILLIAKPETLQYGLEAYYRRLRKYLLEGFENIYILASGSNIDHAHEVAHEFINKIPGEIIAEEKRKIMRRGKCTDSLGIVIRFNVSEITKYQLWDFDVDSLIYAKIESIQSNGITIIIKGRRLFVDKSNLSWLNIQDPKEIYNINDDIKLVVLGFTEKGDPILSGKETIEDPWRDKENIAAIGKIISCKIGTIMNEGIKVYIGNLLNGFIPNNQIDTLSMQKIKKRIIRTEIPINAEVIKYDEDKHYIILSLINIHLASVSKIKGLYPVGCKIKGIVTAVEDKYAFVSLPDSTAGFVYISEVSWNRIKSVKDVLKVDQEIEAIVIYHDSETCRLILSIKNALGNPWLSLNMKVGDKTKGKVIEIRENGIVVELPEETNGFKPTGFIFKDQLILRDENISIEDIISEDDIIEISIKKLDRENQSLILTQKEYSFKKAERASIQYQEGQQVVAKIVKIYPGGILTTINDNTRAFLPFQNIIGGFKKSGLVIGKTIKCNIARIDSEEDKIELFIPEKS